MDLYFGHIDNLNQITDRRWRIYRTNAIPLFHDLESLIDLTESKSMSNELIDFELPGQIVLNKGRQLRSAFDSAEGRSSPHTASDKLEWSGLNLLSSSRNTDDYTLAPSFMTRFQCSSHDADIAGTVEGIVTSTISDVDEVFLDGLVNFGRIDEICCTEFLGPGFLTVVGVYGNDSLGTVSDTALDDAETNTSGTENGADSALFDFCGPCRGTEASRDPAAQETGFVERSYWIDCDDWDVRHDCTLNQRKRAITSILGECRCPHVVKDVLASSTETGCAVRHHAFTLRSADFAAQICLAALLIRSINARMRPCRTCILHIQECKEEPHGRRPWRSWRLRRQTRRFLHPRVHRSQEKRLQDPFPKGYKRLCDKPTTISACFWSDGIDSFFGWHTPVQRILTRTSCALGGATSTSSMDSFAPAPHAIAACPASTWAKP